MRNGTFSEQGNAIFAFKRGMLSDLISSCVPSRRQSRSRCFLHEHQVNNKPQVLLRFSQGGPNSLKGSKSGGPILPVDFDSEV